MILAEYRTLSLDFRKVSSNMLTARADIALIELKRFKNFIDNSPIIIQVLQKQISNVNFDFRDCFQKEMDGYRYYIVPPVEEDLHLKAQYDFLSHLCSDYREIKGIAHKFVFKTGKYDDIVREFLERAFKPLVDFIVNSLTKTILILEGEQPMKNNITQNIAHNYGNVNAAGRDAVMNIHSAGESIEDIKALIQKLIPTITNTQLTAEEQEFLIDDMETITEQIESYFT
ncbi:hypothetical protein ACE3MZ_13085 [Paenibacillus sp. WLX1005]|uniref:hypothetical protein n=1 Tax=Paenibacillus sp. WLX1005 TaxID=3243766 RepID=UPI003984177E